VLLTPVWRDRLRQIRHPAVRSLVKRLDSPQAVSATALPVQRPSVPLLLRVPAPLLAGDNAHALTRNLEEVLNEFQLNLGLTLPRIHLHGVQPGVDMHGVPAAGGAVWELLAFEVPIARGNLPADDTHAALAEATRQALKRHASLFLGTQDTTNLLTRASADVPDIVKEVLRALPLQRVADVLRRLVSEQVSIRNLRDILEALAEASQREKDVHALTEFTRVALRRQISHQVAPQNKLSVVMLQPPLEELLRQAVRVSGGVSQLALEPETARRVCDAIAAAVAQHKPAALATAIDVRWHLRKLVEAECFDTPVLSYHELMPTLQLDVLDRVATPSTALLGTT
jgi:type III secretion protein V